MPKSRGRRPRKAHDSGRRRGSARRPRDLAGLAAFIPVMQAADAAEARGDAATALDLMAAHPEGPDGKLFWRTERLQRLVQLVALGPILPGWATSRWILAQAVQCLDESTRGRGRRALEVAVRTRGGPGGLEGVDRVDAQCKVMDHDWVYRQVFLYELGGLEHFLRRLATPDLLVGADRIEDWARTPMGAYRLLAESPGLLTWTDLGSGGTVETPNIGSATLLEPGDCAIGRAVPIEEGTMFESAPLFVPDSTAARVVADPAGWLDAVAAACGERDDHDEPVCRTGGHDFELLTDVPLIVRLWLQRKIVADRGRSRSLRDLDQMPYEAASFIRAAVRGEFDHEDGVSPWPSVAAALLEPEVTDLLLDGLGASDLPAVARLADDLARPAADVCRWIAGDLRESA